MTGPTTDDHDGTTPDPGGRQRRRTERPRPRRPRRWSRRRLLRRGAAGAAGLFAGAVAGAPMINPGRVRLFAAPEQREVGTYSTRAVDLVRRATVIDMLSPFKLGDNPWLRDPDSFTVEDLARFRESEIDVFHVATGIGGAVDPVGDVLRFVAAWNGFIAAHGDWLMRIDGADDLDTARDSDKVGVLIGVQNSAHLTRRLEDVDLFWSLGQRVSQLTYNSRNRIGNGSTERVDGGLSDYGIAVVRRMNRVGMAVDVSHCGDRTTLDALEVSEAPVLITHSNARALVPGHPRCKTDAAIRAMAAKGGVMGITGVRMFVRDREPTTLDHVLDHFDHVARLVGVEHVGVGSDVDLDGYDDMPPEALEGLRSNYKDSYAFRDRIDVEGLDHPKRMFDLTEGLLQRGYSDDDVLGILGGNFRRVLTEIWSRREADAAPEGRPGGGRSRPGRHRRRVVGWKRAPGGPERSSGGGRRR